ncbi:hypothetical protein OUZ56_004457 [Daphnia magna]|uniref:Uncharacterized protein n=1 Tax=Daphnia magna TaxID=35525 RepID=A0ABQ9YPW0_9CRUS|nr:hypothetical protein OUZ56_004457 [Daphnia magna]
MPTIPTAKEPRFRAFAFKKKGSWNVECDVPVKIRNSSLLLYARRIAGRLDLAVLLPSEGVSKKPTGAIVFVIMRAGGGWREHSDFLLRLPLACCVEMLQGRLNFETTAVLKL